MKTFEPDRPESTGIDSDLPWGDAAVPTQTTKLVRIRRPSAAEKLAELRAIAESVGGRCLSDVFVNANTMLEWECSEGHSWSTIPKLVRRGSWCPICAKSFGTKGGLVAWLSDRAAAAEGKKPKAKLRLSVDILQAVARERGGECLSTDYRGSRQRVRWRCAVGHEWDATPSSVIYGRWCSVCALEGRRGVRSETLKAGIALAEARGGRLITADVVQDDIPLEWECERGHRWRTRLKSIQAGKWCHVCTKYQRKTPDDAQMLAQSRGGGFVDSVLPSTNARVQWRCAHGHVWRATYNSIDSHGSWCPECATGLGERICRAYFEQLFGQPFPKVRVDWIRSANGRPLELDGYCEPLRLAFEHQGLHHYASRSLFKGTADDLAKQQAIDQRKADACREAGVLLIQVPQLGHLLETDALRPFIKKALLDAGRQVPTEFHAKQVDLRQAYSTSGAVAAIEELRELARARGGECLSLSYRGNLRHLEWRCASNHRWLATPQSIKTGYWCRECSQSRRRVPEAVAQDFAKARGGSFLGFSRGGGKTKARYRCAKLHEWTAEWKNNRRGSWCPYCSGIFPLGIKVFQGIAEAKGGKCLSTEYESNESRLEFECAAGHRWTTRALIVRRGSWCPKCSKVASRRTR